MGERADAKPVLLRDVCGDDRRSAGARNDEHARPRGRPNIGQGFGKIVQLLQRIRAVDSELTEDSVVDLVFPGQRSGMRLGGLASLLGPSGLQDHDGLLTFLDAARNFPASFTPSM